MVTRRGHDKKCRVKAKISRRLFDVLHLAKLRRV